MDDESFLYKMGFEYGANPASHEHFDGCGHSGEGVEALFYNGWREGRKHRAAPRAEGLLEAATALADATAAEHADCTSDHCHWCPLVDAVRAALKAYGDPENPPQNFLAETPDVERAKRSEGSDV